MRITTAALSAALAFAAAAPAQADVVYSFTQVGPATNQTPASFPGASQPLNLAGQITVSDAAAANGFSLSLDRSDFFGTYTASLAGLVGITVSGTYIPTLGTSAIINPGIPPAIGQFVNGSNVRLALQGSATAGLTGTFSYFTQAGYDFAFTFAGSSFTGTFSSDNTSTGCVGLQDCVFGGTVATSTTGASDGTPTPVPEPASLAMFGIGLAGLGLVRRKRRT